MESKRFGLERLAKSITSISDSVGTPFYAYDWATIQRITDLLLSCTSDFEYLGRARFYIAFFALPNANIFRRLLRLNPRLGINCNTFEEILALQEFGLTDWDPVVFTGGVLPEDDLLSIARTGCLLNVASQGNLKKLLESSLYPCKIGLRLDFTNIALKGLRVSEIESCLELAEKCGKQIECFHAYPGTEIDNIDLLIRHAQTLISLASRYPQIKEINFGGGFWYDYKNLSGEVCAMVDFLMYFSSIKKMLEQMLPGKRVNLCWEPGRIIFAGAGFFITRVVEIRRSSINTADVYVDSSFTHLPSPKIRNRQHRVIIIGPNGAIRTGIDLEARICGVTTLSTDQIIPGLCPMPEPEPEDLLVILDVGAYGHAGSYGFLGKARAPEVLLDNSGWELIRGRQSANHLLHGLTLDNSGMLWKDDFSSLRKLSRRSEHQKVCPG